MIKLKGGNPSVAPENLRPDVQKRNEKGEPDLRGGLCLIGAVSEEREA